MAYDSNQCHLYSSTVACICLLQKRQCINLKHSKNVATQTTIDDSNEGAAQEQLIEQLNELIDQFMLRSNRVYAYDTKVRWTINREKELKFNVIITNKPPVKLSYAYDV